MSSSGPSLPAPDARLLRKWTRGFAKAKQVRFEGDSLNPSKIITSGKSSDGKHTVERREFSLEPGRTKHLIEEFREWLEEVDPERNLVAYGLLDHQVAQVAFLRYLVEFPAPR